MRLCVVLCTLEFTIIYLYICISAVFMNIWSQQRWNIFFLFLFFLQTWWRKIFVDQRGAKILNVWKLKSSVLCVIFSFFLIYGQLADEVLFYLSIDLPIYLFTYFSHSWSNILFLKNTDWILVYFCFFFFIFNCDIFLFCNYWYSSQYLGLSWLTSLPLIDACSRLLC